MRRHRPLPAVVLLNVPSGLPNHGQPGVGIVPVRDGEDRPFAAHREQVRQLVSLARAALVDPAVLVLDEATSNLDPGTELIVEHALDSLMLGRTTIVVAHRLSTIQRADRIGVIDGGRLVELGNHTELVELGGKYAALADAWAKSQPVV